MSALTAIELGADTCVLVKAAVRRADVSVRGIDTMDPAAFPGPDGLATALRQLRKTRRLPRRARIVLWGLPDGASVSDPAVAPLLAPVKKAGFRIDRVVSPCNALAALSRLREPRHESAVAWLAVNRASVAIAVVRPGQLLFTRSFDWDSSIGATGSQARLLQRYSLVAFLAPELRRGIEAARAQGWRVDAIITCGNLPDLRSLTMPLIEELDVEVETLDSLDGLTVRPALKDALTESAPAIRIACAGAVARASRGKPGSPQRFSGGGLFRAAALVIVIAGVGWLWLSGRGATPKAPASPALPPAASRAAQPNPVQAQPAAPRPTIAAPAPSIVPQRTAPADSRVKTTPPPAPVKTAPPPGSAKPTVAPLSPKPSPKPQPAAAAATPRPPTAAATGATPAPAATRPPRPTALRPEAEPLTDPLPRVTTILVSQERRFAVLEGGRVVSVGDTIGRRVVTSIEPRAVVLKEPSGVQIRVGLGGRLAGVDKSR